MMYKRFLFLGLTLLAFPLAAAGPPPAFQGCEQNDVVVYSRECLQPTATPPARPAGPPAVSRCNADALDRAAYTGDLATLRQCRPGLNRLAASTPAGPGQGRTLLHWAVAGGRAGTLAHLIEAGAPLGAASRSDRGGQPLHLAADRGEPDLAGLLLEAGAPLQGRDLFGYSPLHRAAVAGRAAMVEYLLGVGARVDARDRTGKTPLMLAARENHPRIVTLLLRAGAEPGAVNRQGLGALDYAQGHDSVSGALLAAGSAPRDALETLVREGVEKHWPQIEARLSREPLPSAGQLQQLLGLSVQQAHLPLFRLLLEQGADPGDLRLAHFHQRTLFLRRLLEEGLLDPVPAAASRESEADPRGEDRS